MKSTRSYKYVKSWCWKQFDLHVAVSASALNKWMLIALKYVKALFESSSGVVTWSGNVYKTNHQTKPLWTLSQSGFWFLAAQTRCFLKHIKMREIQLGMWISKIVCILKTKANSWRRFSAFKASYVHRDKLKKLIEANISTTRSRLNKQIVFHLHDIVDESLEA